VMLVSDHQSRGKFSLYEGAHVPAIARWPRGIEAGRTVSGLAANIDLAPTFVELAGGDPATPNFDGRSLLPLLRGREVAWRDALHLEIGYARAVVTPGWKYIALRFPEAVRAELTAGGHLESAGWNGRVWRQGNEIASRYGIADEFPHYTDADQLYDLERDPLERRNVAADAQHAGRLDEMRALLREGLAALPHTFGEFRPSAP